MTITINVDSGDLKEVHLIFKDGGVATASPAVVNNTVHAPLGVAPIYENIKATGSNARDRKVGSVKPLAESAQELSPEEDASTVVIPVIEREEKISDTMQETY